MGFHCNSKKFDAFLSKISEDYEVWGPKRFVGEGAYSDTDCIRYGKVRFVEEIEWKEKSDFSFKEVLTPISQTLFYFTEQQAKEPDDVKRGAVVFLRSCDMHAVKRLDTMYLHNGPEDIYYKRIRDKIKFIQIGCSETFENCFCVSMGTNRCDDYDLCVNYRDGAFDVDCKNTDWNHLFLSLNCQEKPVRPDCVLKNSVEVKIPENLTAAVAKSDQWNAYSSRCINCGRCNFVCPTCTCFTMQDLHYSENANVGERRRVWASCMVDGFTDVAGGGSCRKTNGERMRFKVLHKMLDFRQRFGFQMCVGCGRCDDICPEYISFSACANKLTEMMEETQNEK